LIATDLPEQARTRVAIRAYYEHSFTLGDENKQVTEGVWLSEPERAHAALAELPVAGGTWQDDAAPLEDALEEIARKLGKRRRRRACALLVVAGRPPHPVRQGQDPERELAQPCPRKYEWQRAHRDLRDAGARFVAVVDKGGATDAEHWRRLGADHLAVLDDVGPRDLAEALRIIPAGIPALPFPLRGDQE
jgi:hypothetical protein